VPGIESLLSAMPARLSGGQAHRVALGCLIKMASDLGRSEAIEITVFYPGDELPPLLATERDVHAVGIPRTAD
jgi:hypothetical protein